MKPTKPLLAIDDAIITRAFQPVCDSLADRTTPKNIGLFFAMGGIVATGALAFLSSGSDRIVSIALNAMFFADYIGYSRRPEARDGARNIERVSPVRVIVRLNNILIALISFVQFGCLWVGWDTGAPGEIMRKGLFCAAVVLTTAAMYFLACDRPRPKRQFSWNTKLAPTPNAVTETTR